MAEGIAKPPLRQRLIALALAYAVALASLLGAANTARAAAAVADAPFSALCHQESGSGPATPDESNRGQLCADCCLGCLMLAAALPPPPAPAAAVILSSGQHLAAATSAAPSGAPQAIAHRPRAPPLPV